MGKLKPFFFGTVLGAGLAVCALQFHVVQSHEGVRVVPRTPQASLGLAYADVRDWDADTWADRPELVRALIANGSTELVASSVAQDVVDSTVSDDSTLGQLREFLNQGGTQASESAPDFPLITPDAEGDDAFDEMFKLPFPQEAKNESSDGTSERNRIARRDLPDIDQVLGQDVSSMDEIDGSGFRREESNGRGSRTTSRQNRYGSNTAARDDERNNSYNSDAFNAASQRPRYLSDERTSSGYDTDPSASARTSASNRFSDQAYGDERSERSSANGVDADGNTNRRSQSRSFNSAATSADGESPEDSSSGYRRSSGTFDERGADRSRAGGSGRSGSYSSAAEETEALEAMLFGDSAADGSSLSDDATAGSTEWGSDDSSTGMFEDVTSQLEDRAASALQRARSSFGQEARGAVQDTMRSTGRYVRDQVPQRGSATNDSGSAASANLPPALKALQDGFDPFVE